MPRKGAECVLPHDSGRENSVLEEALDSWGSAGDVYASPRIARYPKSAHFHDWVRVGECLYRAIESYDEPGIERREQGRRERRGSSSKLVSAS